MTGLGYMKSKFISEDISGPKCITKQETENVNSR